MKIGAFVAALLALALSADGLAAQEVRTYAKSAPYEDVKFDLVNAIEGEGLTVEFNGQLASMLDRTGPDVGSTKQIYTHAEFFTFCSAKYSRRMMEADPINIGFCPFVVFIYEAAGKPGETVVGYRRPVSQDGKSADPTLADVDTLLDKIVKAAVQ